MIIESGYLGYLKYDGDAVEEGIMDARDSASALLGFDEAFRYFVQQEKPAWGKEDLNLPVRIKKGCWQILIPAGIAVFAGYRAFLLESNDPEDREYTDDADQIREILIHGNYLSQKDIELCAAFGWQQHEELKMHTNFLGIESLHQTLKDQYVFEESI